MGGSPDVGSNIVQVQLLYFVIVLKSVFLSVWNLLDFSFTLNACFFTYYYKKKKKNLNTLNIFKHSITIFIYYHIFVCNLTASYEHSTTLDRHLLLVLANVFQYVSGSLVPW